MSSTANPSSSIVAGATPGASTVQTAIAGAAGPAQTFTVSTGIVLNPLPPQTLNTQQLTEDQARALAVTRRNRFNEFWAGAWLATIPGSWATITSINWNNIRVPERGHIVEIALFFITGTAFFLSLLNYKDPTSEEVLTQLFPAASRPGLFERAARWAGRCVGAFKNASRTL